MVPPSINALMSCVGSEYFCKIFFDFGVSAFVTNFFPASSAALDPTSRAFFAPSLATLFPTSRAEDAICLAALLVKILVKKFVMVSKIPEPPYAYLFFKSESSDYHILKSQWRPTIKVFVYKIQVNFIHTILKYGDYYDFMDR